MSIAFLDRNQQTIKFVDGQKVFEAEQTREITKNKDELMYDVMSVLMEYDEELLDAYYFGTSESDDSFSMYRITSLNDESEKMSVIGPHFAQDELNGYTVKDIRPNNEACGVVAKRLLEGTEWRLGHIDSGIKNVTTNFYYISVKEALKKLQEVAGCEILFKATVTGEGVIDKWIEIYKNIGVVSNRRFTYGENALTVVREEERADIFTSVLGRGRGEEVGDGYGRRIEFTDVEWKTSSDKPLNKPKGQNWLEYPEMTQLYGIPSKSGKMLKREKVVIFEDIEDPAELLQATYDELIECSRPLIQFKTSVLGADDLGNMVTIHHHEKGYHYATRVYKVVKDLVRNTVQAELGDNITRNAAIKTANTVRKVTALEEEKMAFYDSTEISKFQSDIIRGAGEEGGSVFIMSPSDLGTGNSRAPFQTVHMNGPNLNNSDQFMVQNSVGIGFIEGPFDMTNFKSAWTIDGTLSLGDGMLVLYTEDKGKMMQTTTKGMQFYRGSEKIGLIGTIAKEPRWISQTDTESERALYLGLDDAGEFISLTVNKDTEGIFIPKNNAISIYSKSGVDLIAGTNGFSVNPLGSTATGELVVLGNTFLKGQLTVDENVLLKKNLMVERIDASSIYINGQKVVPGQGGGPGGGGGTGTGGYPSEVTTQADKFAWDLWAFLLANDYSPAAAAGILGNVQGEVGASMNPDTEQVGGPGYGWPQWDGSAYPLVGSPTWDGRAYVQRLIAKAGITYDYTTSDAQSRLIDWCMHNGQWIGQVYPTSVSGFKELTDPKTAANAFELNFERPAAAHPERQGYAQAWYDKFKDLEASQEYGEKGLERLNSLLGQWWGNGQCYAVPAEYSGYLGGCGLGAGTKYALSHVIGNTSAAADIGIAYNWAAVGWTVIQNPSYEDLVIGAICNWERNGKVDSWYADNVYGHTGVIRGLENGRVQTYEQNTELGQMVVERDREFYNSFSSIVIPPK